MSSEDITTYKLVMVMLWRFSERSIVSIIGLVLASPIFIYSLFFNKTSPDLSESEAVELIKTWLEVKPKIFGDPCCFRILMSDILTDKAVVDEDPIGDRGLVVSPS
jgi:hypothetical protein